jgi:DNA helicase-2/ATP-dependent DNA helicase PcrA
MLKRASEVVPHGAQNTGKVWGGTFHSIANRLLRLYGKAAGIGDDFTVMDQADAEDMINVVRHELGLHSREKRFPRKATCLAIYSRCVNGAEELSTVLKRQFPWCAEWQKELKELFRNYVARKQARNVLDYDDLLLYWAQLVEAPDLAQRIAGRFDHILVDEYQDTNKVQADILAGMRSRNGNIMAVGDDAQSIYSFRAATVRNMLEFPERFPGTTIVTLEQNYRSVMPILEITNAIIGQAHSRYAKNLWSERSGGERPNLVLCADETAQDAFVIRQILEHYEAGIPLRKQAVLFRTGHLSDSLEIELTRRNIPYHKYGGLRFLEAAHVKDLIAFLRILENPRDEMAWFRVLQLLPGIGPTAAARAIAHVTDNGDDPLSLDRFIAPPAARDFLRNLVTMIRDIIPIQLGGPAPQIERVRRFYDPLLDTLYDNAPPRRHDLEHLEQVASGYRSRRSFLSDIQLDPPTSTADVAGPPVKDEDWLVLSTIHSAKGCEWDVVCLIHAADGMLPSDMATGSAEEIEEELRLTYVALTRARDHLYVTWPQRYYHRRSAFTDKHIYPQLCRFFTPEIRSLMDCRSYPLDRDGAQPAGPDETVEPRPDAPDIKALIRSRWD